MTKGESDKVCSRCGRKLTERNMVITFSTKPDDYGHKVLCNKCEDKKIIMEMGMNGNKGLLKILEIYSDTEETVSQAFYQGLCEKAIDRIKELERKVMKEEK